MTFPSFFRVLILRQNISKNKLSYLLIFIYFAILKELREQKIFVKLKKSSQSLLVGQKKVFKNTKMLERPGKVFPLSLM